MNTIRSEDRITHHLLDLCFSRVQLHGAVAMSIRIPPAGFCLLSRISRCFGCSQNTRIASSLSITLLNSRDVLTAPVFNTVSKQRLKGRLFNIVVVIIDNYLKHIIFYLRIGATPLVGYLIVTNQLVPACVLFVCAGVTDLLDGYIARRFPSQSSAIGSIIDPLADKFLVTTLFLTLTYVNLIPVWLAAVVIARDVGLISGGIVKRLRTVPQPLTLKRFFSPKIAPFKVFPTSISKLNTLLQLSSVTFSLAAPVFDFCYHPLLTCL
uniref:cardiolipin synthase (CMP-forming) n=1 Tax=Syphacia muris TaxID=451379 RepID=A0A0N5AN15_9BILA